VNTDVSAKFDMDWGSIEVSEDLRFGTSVEVYVDNVFRQWNLKSNIKADELELSTQHRPEGSFWSTKLHGKYNSAKHQCNSTASIVVQDNHYKLAVGGEIELENRTDESKTMEYNKLLKTYSMGFFIYSNRRDAIFSDLFT